MAASPHVLATEAGLSALKAGGIAIEAASAIVATIGVVYPHFCGLGARERRVAHRRPRPRDYFLGIGRAAGDTAGFPDQHSLCAPAFHADVRLRGGHTASRP
jgi:gamma-glutamyltranspeptidase